MVPPASVRVSRVPTYSGFCCGSSDFAYGAFTLFGRLSQNLSAIITSITYAVHNPQPKLSLASFPFARRYSGNRCFFLFLPLLRCFSSRRSPPTVMDWLWDDSAFHCRVSPFGYLRIYGYVRLPEAFRSFLRPSSVLDAKAFTLCSY